MAGNARGVRAESPRARGHGRRIRHNPVVVRRPAVLALVAAVAAVVVSSAHAALFFLFKPTSANAGDLVTVRLGGTPASFTLDDRERPLQRAIRLYLVPDDLAPTVRTRFDSRAQFIGALVPDRGARGVLTVTEDGLLAVQREPDGTLFDKLGWLPKKDWGGNLTVRGERLDGPGKMRVLRVNWGHVYVNGRKGRGSWMTPVTFSSEGCWRITGRVRDITLSYVVKVVARP